MSNEGARLVVRNMSFQATKNKITKFFQPYELLEISLVKKNGRFNGVAFIQLSSPDEASQLRKDFDTKKFMGRVLAIDVAVAKGVFQKTPIKTEPDVEIKQEPLEDEVDQSKQEDSLIMDIKEEPKQSDDNSSESGIESESGSESKDEENDSEPDEEDVSEPSVPQKPKKVFKNVPSKDVTEGRTIFIRGLGSTATVEDLKEKLGKFGKVKSVKMCIDPKTRDFKGSAFVEFERKSGVNACLEAVEDPLYKSSFSIQMRSFQVMRAMGRKEIASKFSEKDEALGPKDKRNIYLAREGVIRGGTLAAKGLSKHDLNIRNDREVIKRRLLKNLHVFVSDKRLCIHNLPEKLTDQQLREIFDKNSPKDAVITEARVMKNKEDLASDSVTKNRGYGFIGFSRHSDALTALRNVNNNPQIFKKDKRPIVEFSLENRAALNAREARLKRSKDNNKRALEEDETSNVEPESKKRKSSVEAPAFSGYKSKKGMTLSTHIGDKKRHKKIKKKTKSKNPEVDLKKVFSSKDIKKTVKTISRNTVNNRFRKQRKHRSDMCNKKKKIAESKAKAQKKMRKK